MTRERAGRSGGGADGHDGNGASADRVPLDARLSALAALGERLDAADASEAPASALDAVVPELGLAAGWIFLSDTVRGDVRRGTLSYASGYGLPPALARDDAEPLRCGGCECQRRFRAGRLARGVNMVTCSRLAAVEGGTDGLELHASVPVRGARGTFGILNLAAPGDRRFAPDELAFLDVVGRQLGAALERARLATERTEAARFGAVLEERQRLSREMHDALSQLLFAASLQLRMAAEDDREPLARTEALLADARAELRALVETSRSPDLSVGLVPALGRLAQRMAPSCEVHLDAAPVDVGEEGEAALYRVAQEGVHNAVRHGGARHVHVALEPGPRGGARLTIDDDGTGVASAEALRGPGLRGLRERLEGLGGGLSVERAGTGGLRLRADLPGETA